MDACPLIRIFIILLLLLKRSIFNKIYLEPGQRKKQRPVEETRGTPSVRNICAQLGCCSSTSRSGDGHHHDHNTQHHVQFEKATLLAAVLGPGSRSPARSRCPGCCLGTQSRLGSCWASLEEEI